MRFCHLLPLAALAAISLLTSACAGLPVQTVQTIRTVEQTALVPAPTGPHAAGRIVESGKVLLEGGYAGNAVFANGDSRYEGESGNVYINHGLRGRFAVGLGPGEIGIDFEYQNAAWGTSAASDTNVEEVERQSLFRAGPQFRGLFFGDRARGFGGFFEFSLGNLPYKRTVYEKTITTTFEYSGPEEWWDFPDSKTEVIGSRVGEKNEDDVYFWARMGLFGSIELFDGFTLMPGLMMQNIPNFWGSKTGTETCISYASLLEACDGNDPRDADPYETNFMMTLFAAATYDLGFIAITGQLYGHPVSDDFEVVESVPFGGDLMVQVVF